MGTTSSPGRSAVALVQGVFLALALVVAAATQTRAAAVGATVVDRQGVRHEVTNLQYQGRSQIEYYVSGDRRVVPFSRVERFHLGDQVGSETQAVSITMRDGSMETGSIVSGASLVPNQDVEGGTSMLNRLTGSTSLGPFFMPIGSVQDVILHHTGPASAAVDTVPRATVVLVSGESFEIGDLRFRDGRRLLYSVGDRDRFQDLAKVSRVEFADETEHEEMRPVTITLWTGKQLQGTMEASRVRLAGETDRAFFDRVHGAFTGKAGAGRFTVGVQDVKLIRFHPPSDAAATGTAADSSQAQQGAAADTSQAQ